MMQLYMTHPGSATERKMGGGWKEIVSSFDTNSQTVMYYKESR